MRNIRRVEAMNSEKNCPVFVMTNTVSDVEGVGVLALTWLRVSTEDTSCCLQEVRSFSYHR